MALTTIRKETAIIERGGGDVLWFSSGWNFRYSIHHQKIGRGSERRYFVVIAELIHHCWKSPGADPPMPPAGAFLSSEVFFQKG